jgi:hypothetical protein
MFGHRILFGVALWILCAGCAGQLESRRMALTMTYRDAARPMPERMAAFDGLLDTFTSGTLERTLDRFVGWPVARTKSRVDGFGPDDVYKPGGTFSLHLVAPDGSDRWITLTGDRVQ